MTCTQKKCFEISDKRFDSSDYKFFDWQTAKWMFSNGINADLFHGEMFNLFVDDYYDLLVFVFFNGIK